MTLRVHDLNVAFGSRAILSGISFAAEAGELVILVGPNGAGKTTLLKAIACLIPSKGEVSWDGQTLRALSALDRSRLLAYLPQGHVAHWPITARDVVAIGRAPFASSLTRLSEENREAIDEAMRATDTLQFGDRPVTELSGGERARVMLARALAADTPIILADEPVASLDPAHQLEVMALLARTARQGRLVLAVIHDLTLAARFGDRVLLISEGRLRADGLPRQVLTPALAAEVFQVETVLVQPGGVEVLLPWRAIR